MKTKILLLTMLIFLALTIAAQQKVTVNATNYDISDNLDLKAVAYLFGESKNLEDFEVKLNDPEFQISNLDLNGDGYVDYLRVVEIKVKKVYVITIQAVLGAEIFQDVATIDVEFKNKKTAYVQIVGNEYVYGRNYIIEPVYVYRPVIYDYFWYPRPTVWVSPWYWSYYPTYYNYRAPYSVHVYHHNVYNQYNHHLNYRYVQTRRIQSHAVLHHKAYRNDWAYRQPNQSFDNRNKGVSNYYELNKRRSAEPGSTFEKSVRSPQNTNRRTSSEWESGNTNRRSERSTSTRVETKAPAKIRSISSEPDNKKSSRRDVSAPVKKSEPAQNSTNVQINESRRSTSNPEKSTRVNNDASSKPINTNVSRSTGTPRSTVDPKPAAKSKSTAAPASREQRRSSSTQPSSNKSEPSRTSAPSKTEAPKSGGRR
ncbi:MAG TPA: hypothetical protein VJY41_02850 [Prolixibacteraceae bacterium]|nr:hypothetical protein [Prolixibacteraceae bacterium]